MREEQRQAERMMIAHGGLAAGTLVAYLLVRHVIGLRALAVALLYATPLAVPVLVLVLPLLLVGVVVLYTAHHLSLRNARRMPMGLVLTGATWLVIFLLAASLFEFYEPLALSLRAFDGVVWGWAAFEIVFAVWWLGPHRTRRCGGI